MRLSFPAPRLLPLTIAAMSSLLVLKTALLAGGVIAGRPGGGAAAIVPAAQAESAPPAHGAHAAEGAKPAEAAIPAEAKKAASAKEPQAGRAAETGATPPAEPARSEPPVDATERALLLDLRKRRTELDARDADLVAREQVLAAAEKRLAARLDEMNGLRSRLEALETARKERDEANWRGMVKLYESMKPRDAAAIFNDLDAAVLLPIVDRMKEAKAALVLSAMQPERARQVTADLARMRGAANSLPPAAPAPAAPRTEAPAPPAAAVPAQASPIPASPDAAPRAAPANAAAAGGGAEGTNRSANAAAGETTKANGKGRT